MGEVVDDPEGDLVPDTCSGCGSGVWGSPPPPPGDGLRRGRGGKLLQLVGGWVGPLAETGGGGGGGLAEAEMGMGWAMEEMVLAVADMTLGSLHTVLGDATNAIM